MWIFVFSLRPGNGIPSFNPFHHFQEDWSLPKSACDAAESHVIYHKVVAFYKCVVGHCLNNHFYNVVFSVTAHCLCLCWFSFHSSHAAVWRSTSATTSVSIHSSLLLDVWKATASTSPWISISSHARQTASLEHLMNFLKAHFVFSLSFDSALVNFYTFLHIFMSIFMHSEYYEVRKGVL